jgi:hypothetical protein
MVIVGSVLFYLLGSQHALQSCDTAQGSPVLKIGDIVNVLSEAGTAQYVARTACA